jgi:hypothetical protein
MRAAATPAISLRQVPVQVGAHTLSSWPRSPAPGPTWPNYEAIDYGKPGQPDLNAEEAAKLVLILRKVKPCQRRFVRYAFPNDGGLQLAVYFEYNATPDPQGVSFTHVLEDPYAYYAPVTGETHVGPIGADDSEGFPQFKYRYEWQPGYPCAGPGG